MIRLRELRNLIAHEYANEKMAEIHAAVAAALSPVLLTVVPRVVAYANDIILRYPA